MPGYLVEHRERHEIGVALSWTRTELNVRWLGRDNQTAIERVSPGCLIVLVRGIGSNRA
jgi:hypothetical protein